MATVSGVPKATPQTPISIFQIKFRITVPFNMLATHLALTLTLLTPSLASFIPSTAQIITEVDHLLNPLPSVLHVDPTYYDELSGIKRKLCTLTSLGEGRDDTDNFLEAVEKCGKGGIIRLPDPT